MAQIEIMQADLPHTLYFKMDKDGKVKQKVNQTDSAFAKQEEANRRARERRAQLRGDVPYTMEEIFRQ